MSSDAPPPPPPSGEPPSSRPAPSGATGWKVATAIATVMGLALAGTIYVLMDRRADDLRAERDAAQEELAAREQADSGLGGLGDLLDGLGDDGGGLDDLLGGDGGGLEDLLGGLGDVDPILLE